MRKRNPCQKLLSKYPESSGPVLRRKKEKQKLSRSVANNVSAGDASMLSDDVLVQDVVEEGLLLPVYNPSRADIASNEVF